MKIEYIEEEGTCYAEVILESLREFERIHEPKELIAVRFNSFKKMPDSEELRAFEFLLNNEVAIMQSLVEGVIKAYNSEYLVEYDYIKEHLPVIETVNDVKEQIEINEIEISGNHVDDYAYVMFKGECSWDEEHGFCVVLHKNKFLELGSWDLRY